MSKFDDIFSRKAKEAFDNYNADHLAGDGWDSFASKYGRKRRRALVIPLWARAASIIILVTAGVLFMNRFINRAPGEPVGRIVRESRSEMTDSIQAISDTNTAEPAITVSVPVTSESEEASRAIVARTGRTGETGSLEGRTGKTGSLAGQAGDTGRLAGQTRDSGTRTDPTSDSDRWARQPGNTDNLAGRTAESVTAGNGVLTKEPATSVLAETGKPDGIFSGVNLAANPMEIRLTDEADSRLNLPPKKALKDYLVLPREKMTTTIMTGLSGMMASINNATTMHRVFQSAFMWNGSSHAGSRFVRVWLWQSTVTDLKAHPEE